MKTYSQAGQDVWVREKLGKISGVFLDVGCSHPTYLSNTKALEEDGWSGWLVDSDLVACEMCRKERTSTVIEGDATKLVFPPEALAVDYLSLDIDYATLEALRNLLAQGLTFKVATVEHDAYRFFGELRDEERRLLREAGYVIERENVGAPDWPFEDWYVRPGC